MGQSGRLGVQQKQSLKLLPLLSALKQHLINPVFKFLI